MELTVSSLHFLRWDIWDKVRDFVKIFKQLMLPSRFKLASKTFLAMCKSELIDLLNQSFEVFILKNSPYQCLKTEVDVFSTKNYQNYQSFKWGILVSIFVINNKCSSICVPFHCEDNKMPLIFCQLVFFCKQIYLNILYLNLKYFYEYQPGAWIKLILIASSMYDTSIWP